MIVSEFPYFFSSKEFVTNRTTTDASHIIMEVYDKCIFIFRYLEIKNMLILRNCTFLKCNQ